ncbi:hypothetical protein KFE96_01850 [Kordiimonas sp. SCSIO 12603]|uniref:hypothetical protein n=1 Tax=Kordiimonas sp. SCSIO 12603 TaxID=2829596 RepID=UPI0021079940|nr:hypothetical protein [Kordiimonas sp. SCSIO 12603]UTW59076.1 hypothetical protein KFE96_01850 [Kordiimonas sp. SCSIO 12603]
MKIRKILAKTLAVFAAYLAIIVSYISLLVLDDPTFEQVWNVTHRIGLPVSLVSSLPYMLIDILMHRFLRKGWVKAFTGTFSFGAILLVVSFFMGGYIYFNVLDISGLI